MDSPIHAITGAYGYTGKYIAAILLARGQSVITLTNSPDRANPFGNSVRPFRFSFEDPARLTETLRGVEVLYNTYWVRFNHPMFTYAQAVRNTEVLFRAAREAGVARIVHVSITNPSESSPLEYFRGKAALEKNLQASGIPHAILRPAVLFGKEDILINNIAWALRHLPLFGVFGKGDYRLQPIYVEDFARLAVQEGESRKNVIINAIGPETFTYRGLVEEIGRIIRKKRFIVPVSPSMGYLACWLLGKMQGDVVITRDEIAGLMAELLYVDSPPAGTTRLTEWITAHSDRIGRTYANELSRRQNRKMLYGKD